MKNITKQVERNNKEQIELINNMRTINEEYTNTIDKLLELDSEEIEQSDDGCGVMSMYNNGVVQLDGETGELIEQYESSLMASRATGIEVGDIELAMIGDMHGAGGYIWVESIQYMVSAHGFVRK